MSLFFRSLRPHIDSGPSAGTFRMLDPPLMGTVLKDVKWERDLNRRTRMYPHYFQTLLLSHAT